MEQNILYSIIFLKRKSNQIESNRKTNWRQATEESWTFSTSVDCEAEAEADTDADAKAKVEAESWSDSENEIKSTGRFFIHGGTFESL